MSSQSNWASEIVARVCRPGATLSVIPRGQDGYCWSAQPLYADALSSEVSKVTDAAIWVTLQRLDQREGMALLRRLAASSPVRFQFRSRHDWLTPNELLGEIYYLTKRFRTSQPQSKLLMIPLAMMEMNLTNPPSFNDDSFSGSPAVRSELTLVNCPVCAAPAALIDTAYPGTEGCLRCQSIFVARA